MPKEPSSNAKGKAKEYVLQPYTKAPLMLVHAPSDRKILVPRLEDYEVRALPLLLILQCPDPIARKCSRYAAKRYRLSLTSGREALLSSPLW